MRSKILIIVALFFSSFIIAQTKVGTINSDYIINIMPERDIIIKQAQKYGARLDSSFAIKVKDYDAKVKVYKEQEKTLSETDKNTKIQELAGLNRELQQYKQNGNKLMQIKQDELMRPLYKKLGDVISQVAKENGYHQILTTTGNQFAYIDEKFDITKLVMDRLGLKEPTETKK